MEIKEVDDVDGIGGKDKGGDSDVDEDRAGDGGWDREGVEMKSRVDMKAEVAGGKDREVDEGEFRGVDRNEDEDGGRNGNRDGTDVNKNWGENSGGIGDGGGDSRKIHGKVKRNTDVLINISMAMKVDNTNLFDFLSLEVD